MDTHRRKSVLYRGPNGYPARDVPVKQPADWAGERTRTRHHNRSALAGPASGLQGPLRSPLHPDRPTGTHILYMLILLLY